MTNAKTYTMEDATEAINVVAAAFTEAIDEVVDDKALRDRIKKTAAINMLSSVLELLIGDESVAR